MLDIQMCWNASCSSQGCSRFLIWKPLFPVRLNNPLKFTQSEIKAALEEEIQAAGWAVEWSILSYKIWCPECKEMLGL